MKAQIENTTLRQDITIRITVEMTLEEAMWIKNAVENTERFTKSARKFAKILGAAIEKYSTQITEPTELPDPF